MSAKIEPTRITRAAHVRHIAKLTKTTKAQARESLNAHLALMQSYLEAGYTVQFMGFGAFDTATRGPRKRYNIPAKKTIIIPARRVVRFTASDELKKAINAPGLPRHDRAAV